MTMTCASRARMIRDALQEGYGVEDIAIMQGFALSLVKDEVRSLRVMGDLARMFPRKEGSIS